MSRTTLSIILACGYIFFSLLINAAAAQVPEQNAVVLIIDGARYTETLGDPSGSYIPRMKDLAQEGSVVSVFLNDSVTVTKRAIPAIWCGSWSPPRDTTVNGAATQYATVPSVWEYYRKKTGAGPTDALYFLKYLTAPWLPSYHPSYGPSYWPSYIVQGSGDSQVWQYALNNLRMHHPRLAVIYLADVDAAGHSGSWLAYTGAISTADSIAGALWDFIQDDTLYRGRTNLIVTNDHGRHSDGISSGFVGHGDGCAGCRQIIFMGTGPGFKRNFSSPSVRTIPDIAPTLGAILGFETAFATGAPMSELLMPIYWRDPGEISFGEVPLESGASAEVKIYNPGGVPLIVGPVEIGTAELIIIPEYLQIPPHDSGRFELRYLPGGAGILDEKILIPHNAVEMEETVRVTGSCVTGEIRRSVGFQANWNLLCLPAAPADPRAALLFPEAVSSAFEYGGAYQPAETLRAGRGFWLKFSAAGETEIAGWPFADDSVDLNEGWNLIGAGSFPLPADSIFTDPGGIISGKIFGYSGGYYTADTLYPGRGYWLKSRSKGLLIIK